MSLIPRILLVCSLLSLSTFSSLQADVFELRIYTVHAGKLDALNTRFRDHTVRLFKKHGMKSVGYWVPVDSPHSNNTLIYVLQHQSRESAKTSWAAFIADPAWKKAYQASRQTGPIVKSVKSEFMKSTDYTPKYSNEKTDKQTVFELRIYRTHPNKLPLLDSRFRDHTIGIFNRFGMKSVAYWHSTDPPASSNQLTYILKHPNRASAKSAWQSFIKDAAWKKVAKESQKDGPFLQQRPESIYMKATDYSAIQ
jgi:hypothetical protein